MLITCVSSFHFIPQTYAGGGAAETVCPPAHELAWRYDVIITTFQRLSSDWAMRGDPRMAERLVLLKVRVSVIDVAGVDQLCLGG
jgi:hypothetical protein